MRAFFGPRQNCELIIDFSIASIDFCPPYLLSGSSDKHIRLIDINTGKGWSTSEELDTISSPSGLSTPEADLELVTCVDEEYKSPAISGVCSTCGHGVVLGASARGTIPGQAGMLRLKRYSNAHAGLVRSVCMNEEWVVSGSYDSTVKVWNRKTGAFICDLTGGHTGRIFGVGFDCTKVVSVGEDQVCGRRCLAGACDTYEFPSASVSGISRMASTPHSSNYDTA